jgi:enolase
MCAEVYRQAGVHIEQRGCRAGVADEGGWWPQFDSNEDGLSALATAIDAAGYRHGEVGISLDIAASEFGANGRYRPGMEAREFDGDEWLDMLVSWVARYPILSLEDPFADDDDEGMRALTQAIGGRVQIVGDDYLVTSASRVDTAATVGACNALLVKPNQAGTITEARRALEAAKRHGWSTVVSARSGETEDVTVTHLAVGWNSGQLKVGSFARSERMAKWNEGLRIEEALGRRARFAGRSALPMFRA